jgi:hypothetical protein
VKNGPKKTCCLLPNLPTGTDDYNTGLRRVLGRNGSRMPAEVVRMAGGMEVLGSFVGSDEWVTAAALAKVEDGAADKSIKYACSELAKLAGSEARNARDIAGSLLRACVVPKMGYLWFCAAPSGPTCCCLPRAPPTTSWRALSARCTTSTPPSSWPAPRLSSGSLPSAPTCPPPSAASGSGP